MAGTTSAAGPAAPDGPDPGRWHRRRQGGRAAEGRRRPPRRRQLATRGPAVPRVRATPAGPPALDGVDRILAVALQGEVLGALSVSKRPGESLTRPRTSCYSASPPRPASCCGT